jgi:hypothetical protein
MASFFEIDVATFNRWKNRHPAFCESLKNGKQMADSNVAAKLYHRALGYDCPATKFATFEGQITDHEEYIEHHPPDTTAAIFWLKNRQPKKWRDKQEIEQTSDLGNLETLINALENSAKPKT